MPRCRSRAVRFCSLDVVFLPASNLRLSAREAGSCWPRLPLSRSTVPVLELTMSQRLNFDAAIVGGGPAGLAAAVNLGRALRSVLVCDRPQPDDRTTRSSTTTTWASRRACRHGNFAHGERRGEAVWRAGLRFRSRRDQEDAGWVRAGGVERRVLPGARGLLGTGVRDHLALLRVLVVRRPQPALVHRLRRVRDAGQAGGGGRQRRRGGDDGAADAPLHAGRDAGDQ